jgi:hypothetical protein
MAGSFQGKHKHNVSLNAISVDSDGVDGAWVSIDGFNRAFVSCMAGEPTAGDSDSAFTFLVYKDTTTNVVSDGSSDDEVAITAATQTIALIAGDSDAVIGGAEYLDIDFVAHGLTTGLLRVTATASAGAASAAPCAATIILYDRCGLNSDTSMTITVPAST